MDFEKHQKWYPIVHEGTCCLWDVDRFKWAKDLEEERGPRMLRDLSTAATLLAMAADDKSHGSTKTTQIYRLELKLRVISRS